MIVFVHGVPETAAVWRKIQAEIDVESVALTLPGFGSPRPEGFTSTKDEYVDWIAEQLDQYDSVDLVGHDWGAALVYRLAMTRPLRSWVADAANAMHPDYVWHSLAKTWRTPGEGEAAMAQMLATPSDELAAQFATLLGIDEKDALETAQGFDETMSAAILSLYRSASPNLYGGWGPWKHSEAPGMILHATNDEFSVEAPARQVATMMGARFQPIESGHVWPYQVPEQAAATLTEFWASAR